MGKAILNKSKTTRKKGKKGLRRENRRGRKEEKGREDEGEKEEGGGRVKERGKEEIDRIAQAKEGNYIF